MNIIEKIDEYLNETKWNLFVTKKGKKEKVNKRPMSKKELEDMMKDYEKSGIKYDSLDSEIITNESETYLTEEKETYITGPFYSMAGIRFERWFKKNIKKKYEEQQDGSVSTFVLYNLTKDEINRVKGIEEFFNER